MPVGGGSAKTKNRHILMKQPNLLIIIGLALALGPLRTASAQTDVHRFGSLSRAPNGGIMLELLGGAPAIFRSYFGLHVIESSSDLVNWTPLATLVRTNRATDSISFLDAPAARLRQRFYRTPTNHFFTPLAKPTGPHAVGRITRMVTDTSRTNRYNIATNKYLRSEDDGLLNDPTKSFPVLFNFAKK